MSEHLRSAFERVEKLLTRSPDRGRQTATSTVRLTGGLRCEIEEGPWRLVADMGENVGGSDSGPSPGVFGRAALGSCMAITYAMWAAKLGVPIDHIEIEVRADYDSRALFGVAEVAAGYSAVRCVVTVESSASEAVVRELLDEADAHSPYVDVFTREQKLERTLRLRARRG